MGSMKTTLNATAGASVVGSLEMTSGGNIVDSSVPYCQFTESVLLTECRKNCYQRALLQIEMAASRQGDPIEMEALLSDVCVLLAEAKQKEEALLDKNGDIQADDYGAPASCRLPPPPLMISRSNSSITVTARPFNLVASHGTKLPRVHHLKLFGKPAGAGTDVSLNNTDFPGTGVSIPFDNESKTCAPVTVTGLQTNDSYVFAFAAFDENGNVISSVGKMCDPIEALNPLPLPLIWSYLADRALKLGFCKIATDASSVVLEGILHRASEESHSNLDRGWEAKPMNGISLKPSIFNRMPDAIMQAFVKSVFVWIDSREPPDFSMKGQIETLKSAKVMQLAAVVAAVADDFELLKEVIWRAYHILLPVMKLQLTGPYLMQAFLLLQQAMLLIPKVSWDEPMHRVFACLSYQITECGVSMAEVKAVKYALFDSKATPQSSSDDDDDAVVEGVDAGAVASTSEGSSPEQHFITDEQKALFDVWQNIPDFADASDHSLIEAASIPPPLPTQEELDDEGNPVSPRSPRESELSPLGAFKINREIGALLTKNPAAAMEAIREQFQGDPSYLRFFCLICKAEVMKGRFPAAEEALEIVFYKKSEASDFVLEVLDEEEVFPSYVRESEDADGEGEDQEEASPIDRLEKTGGSTLGRRKDEEEDLSGPDSRQPSTSEKQVLVTLGDIEVLFAFCDINDALAFGTDYMQENKLNCPKSFAKAAGLTSVVVSLSPVFSDGVESDLTLEIEDVDMEADPDEKEDMLDLVHCQRRKELLRMAEESEEGKGEGGGANGDSGDEAEEPFTIDLRTCAMQALGSAFLRLSTASWRSRCARAWTKLIHNCQLLWNITTSVSLPPHLFSRDHLKDTSQRLSSDPFLRSSTYLLDMLEILRVINIGFEEVDNHDAAEGARDAGVSASIGAGDFGNASLTTGKFAGASTYVHDSNSIDVSTIDVDWVCQYVIYGLKVLCCARQWQDLVDLGRRLNRLTKNRVATSSFPLIIFAQQRLCTRARRKLESRQVDRDKFVKDFETEQAKKPKRRYRVASKVEKTDEERAFDKGRIKLENKVSDAKGELRIQEQRLYEIGQEESSVNKAKSSALESLHVCRHSMMKFIHLIDDPAVDNESAVRDILSSYNRTIALLRDKREKDALVEALQDCGDFHVSMGRIEDANKSWCDAIDALFNTLDAHTHWRALLSDMSGTEGKGKTDSGSFSGAAICQELGHLGCLIGGVLLGKLAKFCCTNDQDRRMEHALMAAELFRAPFSLSLPHPQRLCDFATYAPTQFLLGKNLFADERRLDYASTIMALTEVAAALMEGDLHALALPSICLNEYLCRYLSFDLDGLARARLQKVEACAKAGFIAEGMSVLACILRGSGLPKVHGNYCGEEADGTDGGDSEITEKGAGDGDEEDGAGGQSDEATRAGLNFFGFAPFFNSANVHDDSNAKSLKWLMGEGLELQDGTDADSADSSYGLGAGAAHLRPRLLQLYGEEFADLLSLVRTKVISTLAENEKLPVFTQDESGAEAVEDCDVHKRLRGAADSMVKALQRKMMARIAKSAESSASSAEDAEKDGADESDRGEGQEEKKEEGGTAEQESRLAAIQDIRKAAECLIFRSQLALRERRFKNARKLASTCLALMTRCSGGGMHLREEKLVLAGNRVVMKVEIDNKMWLECRWILASCALGQGRLEDCRAICDAGVGEGREVNEGVWTRRLKLLAVHAAVQMGIEVAEGEARALVVEFLESGSKRFDFVAALVTLNNILEQSVLSKDSLTANELLSEGRKMLEDGENIMLGLAEESGWIGNCPLTYENIRSNEMGAEVKAPLSTALAEKEFGDDFVAVVDVADEVCPTDLTNLYLKSVRWLAFLRCRIGCALTSAIPRAVAVDVNNLGEKFEMVVEEDKASLMRAGRRKAELAMATLRHVGVVHPCVRGEILLLLGMARMWHVVHTKEGDGEQRAAQKAFDESSLALTGALEVFFKCGGFNRVSMQEACLHLVNLYGNAKISGGVGERLKVAIHFLMAGASLGRMHKALVSDVSDLASGIDTSGMKGMLEQDILLEVAAGQKGEEGEEDGINSIELVRYFLASMREQNLVPFDSGLQSAALKIHSALYSSSEAYREKVCCAREGLQLPREDEGKQQDEGGGGASGALVEVKSSLVCVQWYDVDPEELVLDETQKCDNDLHPYVSLMMVVGCGEGDEGAAGKKAAAGGKKGAAKGQGGAAEDGGDSLSKKMADRFGENVGPLLICQGEVFVKSREVSSMKGRVSVMRTKLEKYHSLKNSTDVQPPEGLIVSYVAFIKDMLKMLGRNRAGLGGEGEVLDSLGEQLLLPLTVESLTLLEGFFDVETGVTQQSVEYAYMLRDAFFREEEAMGGDEFAAEQEQVLHQ